MWEYTDELKDHFFNPRNVGEVEKPDGVGEVGSLACGDALKLTQLGLSLALSLIYCIKLGGNHVGPQRGSKYQVEKTESNILFSYHDILLISSGVIVYVLRIVLPPKESN